jgi:hypothetical protein
MQRSKDTKGHVIRLFDPTAPACAESIAMPRLVVWIQRRAVAKDSFLQAFAACAGSYFLQTLAWKAEIQKDIRGGQQVQFWIR